MKIKIWLCILFLEVLFATPTIAAQDNLDLDINCQEIIEVLETQSYKNQTIETSIKVVSMEDAKELTEYFNYCYYKGNDVVSFSLGKDGVDSFYNLFVTTEIPKRAFQQHINANTKIEDISKTIKGNSNREIADSIHQYISNNVTYASADTVNAIILMNEQKQRNFTNIQATCYTAIMEGKTVCYGFSNLFQALCKEKDIKCRVVYNKRHSYNLVTIDGVEVPYDAGLTSLKEQRELETNYSSYLEKSNNIYEVANITPRK